MEISRRTFLGSPAVLMAEPEFAAPVNYEAQWIWYPEQRTLAGTFVFFRKAFDLTAVPAAPSPAWVTGNSRYQLWVNGQFVQRGPAACDPRYWDIDPVNLTPYLKPGRNVIAAIVLHFGGGDGTWVPSTPLGDSGSQGFWFQWDGPAKLRTDGTWKTLRARCWKPGATQRWFLRALQEEFDARAWPAGWSAPEFDDSAWRPASVSRTPAGRPNLPELPREGWHEDWRLRPRTIPMLTETVTAPVRVVDSGWIEWKVPPEEYFECFPPDSFEETRDRSLNPRSLPVTGARSAAVTYDFGREVLGHIRLKMRAPAGTVAEILFVETQREGKVLLRTRAKFGQWVRVVAREGLTEFESFEYDAFRYLQVLVRNANGPVEIVAVEVKERNYPYLHQPDLRSSDEDINRAIAASVATHRICSQDTIVDNQIRERQQYAGDLDHAKMGSYYGFGEYRQPRRMIETFGQGQSAEGWFMDSWPAWDRCARLWQRHMNLAPWGPLIDHALEYGIAAAKYYLFTGDRKLAEEIYPRLKRFDEWLWTNRKPDGLLPRFGWTWNEVWIDHIGYLAEIDKHAALNVYYAGFLRQGVARMAAWLGDTKGAAEANARATEITAAVRQMYWDPQRKMLIDNLPRVSRDGEARVHERTLSMALLFGVMEGPGPGLDLLAGIPSESNAPILEREGGNLKLGFSYPLNVCWRYWALGKFGLGNLIVKDVRVRWPNLPSVKMNGTFAEDWNPGPSETGSVWCQNNAIPMWILYEEVLGIKPLEPGFRVAQVKPQAGDLEWIEGTVHTVMGPLKVRVDGRTKRVQVEAPTGMEVRR